MKKNWSIILHSLSFVICTALAVYALYYMISVRHLNVEYTPASAEESAQSLDNPYRGFYRMSGYILSDGQKPSKAASWCKKSCKDNPYPLMLLEINLKNYSNTRISTNALKQLDKILNECTRAKKQVVLRFLYDWDGQALSSEPSDLSQIKKHISQLSSTVNSYADCIYILQGALIGNNGEMNNSNYNDINQIRQIMEELDQNIVPDIYLAVRTPAQLRGVLRTRNPLSSTNAWHGTLESRLGLFNDGMLGSVYDLGTYDDTPLQSDSAIDEQGTRSEELLFQEKLCQYVPNGGEVTVDNEYNDLDNAITDLFQMHVSYLNSEHDADVLDKWKSSVYTGNTADASDVFSGCTGYDYIDSHLGYRYVMKQSSIDFHPVFSDTATLYIAVSNVGFSSAYIKFDTSLILTDQDTGKSQKIETSIDNRSIAGNDSSEFKINLDVRSLKKGTYTVSLRMKDSRTKTYIHFANKDYEDSKTVPVGTLTLK